MLVLTQTSDEKRLRHEQQSIEMVFLTVSKHEVGSKISTNLLYIVTCQPWELMKGSYISFGVGQTCTAYT